MGIMVNQLAWSAEEDALLKQWWVVEGKSAREIAAALPHPRSRSAVIGRVYRLLGEEREPRRRPNVRFSRATASPPARLPPRAQAASPRASDSANQMSTPPLVCDGGRVNLWPLESTACRLVELQPCRCRWPVGAATGAEQLFCAAIADPAGPYCPGHARESRAGISAKAWDSKNAKALKRAFGS